MATYRASDEIEIAYQEIIALIRRCADEYSMSPLEVLACAANMVGKIIAAQDQEEIPIEEVMDVVLRNIEIGNNQAIDLLRSVHRTAGNA